MLYIRLRVGRDTFYYPFSSHGSDSATNGIALRSGYRAFGKRSTERAIDRFCLVYVSPFTTQWGGTNEQTKRSQSLSFRRSIWPLKNEMDGSQKKRGETPESERHWSVVQIFLKTQKPRASWDGREERERTEKGDSYSPPPQRNEKQKEVMKKRYSVCRCTHVLSSSSRLSGY